MHNKKESENFFYRIGSSWKEFIKHTGRFGYFIYKMLLSLSDVKTWRSLLSDQLMAIGVKSIPIVAFTSTFTGMVTSVQAAYQLETGLVPLYIIGSVVGESIVLELAPVLTGLVLAGRVGATIAAELGTMRVTEQIDALESMGFNPLSYLVVPRVLAGLIMLPVLVVIATFVGIVGGWLIAAVTIDLSTTDFFYGFKEFFKPWDAFYAQIKSISFGLTITLTGSYMGFYTEGGAEGVGKATTSAVVVSCLMILVLDYFLAQVLL